MARGAVVSAERRPGGLLSPQVCFRVTACGTGAEMPRLLEVISRIGPAENRHSSQTGPGSVG